MLKRFGQDRVSVLLIYTNGELHRWTKCPLVQPQTISYIVQLGPLTKLAGDGLLRLYVTLMRTRSAG